MGTYSAKQRKKLATLPGGRFPIGDQNHARLALSMLGRAKGLSDAEKLKVKRRALAVLQGQRAGR